MGVEFFRRSVELADGFLRPGQRAAYTIQTNATLLDEEWAEFSSPSTTSSPASRSMGRERYTIAYRVDKAARQL